MTQADSDSAERLGMWLGDKAWNATVAIVRNAIVVVFLASVFHALRPGMAFGAWAEIFTAVAVIAGIFKLVSAIFRHALRYARRAWRARSGAPLSHN